MSRGAKKPTSRFTSVVSARASGVKAAYGVTP